MSKFSATQACCQAMATATAADRVLYLLKAFLDENLKGLSLSCLGNVTPENSDIHLMVNLNAEGELSGHCGAMIPDETSSPFIKGKKFIALLNNVDVNSNHAIQAELTGLLQGLIDKNNRLACFYLTTSSDNSYWCLLDYLKDDESEQYIQQNFDLILTMINLAFSHIARIEALAALKKENDWVQDELKQIATLQRLLLPKDDIKIKGVDVAASFRACDQAGGDYYDLVAMTEIFEPGSEPRENDFWGAMIADSAGHGASAAVEVAMFDAILRTINPANSNISDGPAGVFNYTNPYLFTRLIRGTFITAFVAGYNPDSETISYSCAGHPPALLYRRDNKNPVEPIELDQSNGIPLGVIKDFEWSNVIVPFLQNDLLLFYTDGLLEAANPDGEQFGLSRLKQLIVEYYDLPSKEIVGKIETAIDGFQESDDRKDDQTLLILKRIK